MNSQFNQPLHLELSITVSGATIGRIAELLLAIASGVSVRANTEVPRKASEPQQPEELVLDRIQTAKLLKLNPETLSRMARHRKMPQPLRFGRTIRWCRDEIEAWAKAGCPPMDSWNYRAQQRNG